MTNIAIFVSGSGTNCENIIRYFQDSKRARVSLVVSNKIDAYALVRAHNHGVPTEVWTKDRFSDAAATIELLSSYKIDFIVLAGFLLKVPDYLIVAYPQKIINIHPALLPDYGGKGMYGDHVHRAVLEAREQVSGITIHLVNERYDEGRHLLQATCPVLEGDTPETLASRIHELEHRFFPTTIAQYLRFLPYRDQCYL